MEEKINNLYQNEDKKNIFEDEKILEPLRAAGGWALFLSVVNFIISGFLLIAFFINAFIKESAINAIIALFGIGISLALAFFLRGFGMNVLEQEKSENLIKEKIFLAVTNLKNYFAVTGILNLIIIIILFFYMLFVHYIP